MQAITSNSRAHTLRHPCTGEDRGDHGRGRRLSNVGATETKVGGHLGSISPRVSLVRSMCGLHLQALTTTVREDRYYGLSILFVLLFSLNTHPSSRPTPKEADTENLNHTKRIDRSFRHTPVDHTLLLRMALGLMNSSWLVGYHLCTPSQTPSSA